MNKVINKILNKSDRLITKIFHWIAKEDSCIPLKLLLVGMPLGIILLVFFFVPKGLYNAIFKK
jgi:hypothetical protein